MTTKLASALGMWRWVQDVATGRVLYYKIFGFRGDNETAWRRAAKYMVRALAQIFGEPKP